MGLAPVGVWAVWAPRVGAALAGNVGTGGAFALSREERGLIASSARSGPIPLPLGDLEPVPGGSIWSLSLDWAGQRGGVWAV